MKLIKKELTSEMKKKKASVASSVQFRNDMLESQKRINSQNEFDRLQGAKLMSALHPNVESRMKDLQHKARESFKGETHAIYKTVFSIISQYIEHGILSKA